MKEPTMDIRRFRWACKPMPTKLSRTRAALAQTSLTGLELDPWEMARTAIDMAASARQTIHQQRSRIDELENLILTDELTGLANRRGFLAGLDRVLGCAERYRDGGALAFLDIDAFKQINDTHGHASGDSVLRKVGEVLIANTRGSDVVSRFGGDEFAVLLFRLGRREAMARVEQLNGMLNSTVARHGPTEIPIRVSFGAVPFGPDDDAEDLLRRADSAMYREKLSAAGPRLVAGYETSPSELSSAP